MAYSSSFSSPLFAAAAAAAVALSRHKNQRTFRKKERKKKKREQTQAIILRRALFPPPPPLLITAIAGCGFRSPPLRHCLRNLLSRRRCRRRLIFSSKTEGLESSFISTITSHSETSVSVGRFGCVVGDCFE